MSIPFFGGADFGNKSRRAASEPLDFTFTMNTRIFTSASALLALGLAGCESGGPRGARNAGTGDAPMTASGELANPNPKPMDAQAKFFAGQIEIEAMLAKSDAAWRNAEPGEASRARGGRSGGGFSGGFGGGGGRRGNGRGMGGGRGGDAPPPSADAPRAAAIRPTNAPPVQLRLRLTNHGEQPAEVEVLDFNSELGNFAVQPEKFALAANETVEANPMTSRLGVPAGEEIPITVRLRIGGKTGQAETQIVKLKPRDDALTAAK